METATRTIYVLSGLPFSGKTTIAKSLLVDGGLLIERDRFLEEINREPETIARLQQEALMLHEPVSRLAASKLANAFNDALTREYVKRVSSTIQISSAKLIVVDGTHLQPLSRQFIRQINDTVCIALIVDRPFSLCIDRWRSSVTQGVRSTITEDLIRRMQTVFKAPTKEEGFAEIRYV
jgi:uridine kinase